MPKTSLQPAWLLGTKPAWHTQAHGLLTVRLHTMLTPRISSRTAITIEQTTCVHCDCARTVSSPIPELIDIHRPGIASI